MELLKELDNVCKEKWVLACLGKSKSKNKEEDLLTRLYRLIHTGTLSDPEMVVDLYGDGTPPSDARYRTLKTRLKEVLLNAFLMEEQEVPSYKTYDEAFRNGHRLLSIVRLLMDQKAYLAAKKIALQTFQQVQHFEIIPLNQGLTNMIAGLHLGVSYDEKKFILYNDLNSYYNKAAYDLSIVVGYYRTFRNIFYAQRLAPIEIGQVAISYIKACKEIKKTYIKVSLIQAMLISIEMIGCMLRGEHKEAIQVSLEGANTLNQCKGSSHGLKRSLALDRVECCIKLKDFDFGKEQLQLAKPYATDNLINKASLSQRAILLGLSTNNYMFAYKSLSKINLQNIKNILSARHFEEWLVLEASINFLIQARKITLKPNSPSTRRFRVGAFTNKVPTLSQNKAGTNIQILVYQNLFLLIKGKRDELINRQESLTTYARRHLKGPANIRNRSFFKLLGIMVKANFNRLAAMKKAQKTIQILKESQGQPNLNDTELVPYEALWEIALEHLDVNKRDERELAQLTKTKADG